MRRSVTTRQEGAQVVATSRRVRHLRLVSAATLAALLAGAVSSCGGSDSDEAAVTDLSSTTPAPTSPKETEPSASSGTTTSMAVTAGTEPWASSRSATQV
jgi:hypothetical protein